MHRLAVFFLFLLVSLRAHGHAVPSLTVEAVFKGDRSYVLRVNVDPRLFLSDKPTSLPPIEAAWYRDQNPEQIKATEKRCTDYLSMALALRFGEATAPLPAIDYQPMDGATNLPFSPETKEVHLLAEMHGQAPAGAPAFSIALGKDANTSLILINSLDGKEERRPQVLFPGETSRPFGLPGASSPAPEPPPVQTATIVSVGEVQEVSREGPLIVALSAAAAGGLVMLVRRLLRKK